MTFRKPATVVINSRCDIRSLATLHHYYNKKGYGNLNMSQLVRLVLDDFADAVVTNLQAQEFPSSYDAAAYIDKVKMSVPRGNRRSLIEQIQKETLVDEGFKPAVGPLHGQPVPRKVPTSLVERARKMMRKDDPETLQEAADRRAEELKETRGQLGVVPD